MHGVFLSISIWDWYLTMFVKGAPAGWGLYTNYASIAEYDSMANGLYNLSHDSATDKHRINEHVRAYIYL